MCPVFLGGAFCCPNTPTPCSTVLCLTYKKNRLAKVRGKFKPRTAHTMPPRVEVIFEYTSCQVQPPQTWATNILPATYSLALYTAQDADRLQ